MLVDLSRSGPLTINPFEYVTSLAVQLDTDDRPECGVFAGKHTDFAEHEECKIVPVVDDTETGCKTFLLDRPERGNRLHIVRRWHYAAIGWESGVYLEHPYAYELILQEHNGGPENYFWVFSVNMNMVPCFRLILSDYEPGALAREAAAALST